MKNSSAAVARSSFFFLVTVLGILLGLAWFSWHRAASEKPHSVTETK